jgi:hypothetical protein
MIVYTRRALAVLALALFTSAVAAQSPSVAGKWDLVVKSPHGDVAMGLDLKQDGATVTGTLLNFRGQDLPVKGQYAGGELSLATNGDDIALSAKFKADGTLAGYLSTAMGDLTWTGTLTKASR